MIYLLTFISALTLAGAWFFELVLGLDPCPLCLTQRLPHYVIVVLGMIFYVYKNDKKAFLLLFALIFTYSTGLAAYHAGAEWGFWAGPTTCGGGGKALSITASDLLKNLNSVKVSDCTVVQWKFLGISLAGYNAIISFLAALYAFKALVLDPNKGNQASSHGNN